MSHLLSHPLISTGHRLLSEGVLNMVWQPCLPEHRHFVTVEACRKDSAAFRHKGDASAVTMDIGSIGRTVTAWLSVVPSWVLLTATQEVLKCKI